MFDSSGFLQREARFVTGKIRTTVTLVYYLVAGPCSRCRPIVRKWRTLMNTIAQIKLRHRNRLWRERCDHDKRLQERWTQPSVMVKFKVLSMVLGHGAKALCRAKKATVNCPKLLEALTSLMGESKGCVWKAAKNLTRFGGKHSRQVETAILVKTLAEHSSPVQSLLLAYVHMREENTDALLSKHIKKQRLVTCMHD
jgi:hypothetical protein